MKIILSREALELFKSSRRNVLRVSTEIANQYGNYSVSCRGRDNLIPVQPFIKKFAEPLFRSIVEMSSGPDDDQVHFGLLELPLASREPVECDFTWTVKLQPLVDLKLTSHL